MALSAVAVWVFITISAFPVSALAQTNDAALLLFEQAASMEQENPTQAIATYEQVMQRFGRRTPAATRALAARALLNKGSVFSEQGHLKDAIYTYERIERNFGNERLPDIREVLASALVSRAEAFYKLGDTEKTLALYTQLAQRFGNDENDYIRSLIDVTSWRIAEIKVADKTALSSRP
ncbi:MAG: tetratricopeptide repeat protein [Azoarcus sp.]|nr:tetratricopeptide repeat protein [Azoarcus sp.]